MAKQHRSTHTHNARVLTYENRWSHIMEMNGNIRTNCMQSTQRDAFMHNCIIESSCMLWRCEGMQISYAEAENLKNRTFLSNARVFTFISVAFGQMIDRSNMQNKISLGLGIAHGNSSLSMWAYIFIIPLWLLGQFCVSLHFVSSINISLKRGERNSEWEDRY